MAVRDARVLAQRGRPRGGGPRHAKRVVLDASMGVAASRRAVLREALDQVLDNVPGALAGKDAEYLHQLRVGTRRLRTALRVFRGTMHRAEERALERTLRTLAKVTGPARDWDVNLRRLPAALRPAAVRRQRAAHARLRRVLGAMQLWLLPRGLATSHPDLPTYAGEVLDDLERKALRRGRNMNWSRPRRRHALRVRLRRLRYASEFLSGAFPERDSEPLVRALKHLQDLLGELNDMEVTRRLVRELRGNGARRAPGRRERELIAMLPAGWRRFASAPRFWRPARKLGSDPNFRSSGV